MNAIEKYIEFAALAFVLPYIQYSHVYGHNQVHLIIIFLVYFIKS